MHRPFDIVHIAQSPFPEDWRVRHETQVAAHERGTRVAVVALDVGRDRRRVSRYGDVAVMRLGGTRRRASPMRYIVEYFSFALRAYLLMRRDPRLRSAAIVHIHTLPDFLIAAALPAKQRGARVVLDLHEIFPEFVRAKYRGLPGRFVGALAGLAERWARRTADATITVNEPIADLLRRRPAKRLERLIVLHNTPDEEELGPPRTPAPSPTASSEVRFVYHGTLTRMYGLDLAIAAIARVRAGGYAVTLDIFGDGPERSALARQITDLGAGDAIRLAGVIPHSELGVVLPRYDAGFVPTRLDEMTQFSLSTKLLEYVHLGIPVIVPRIRTYEQYLTPAGAWYFTPNDAAAAAQAIIALCDASPQERRQRAAIAQAAMAPHRWPKAARLLASLYRELRDARGVTAW